MVGHSRVPGHIEYSRLLQDCFFDLNDVFVYHKGGDLSLSSTKGDTSMKTTMCWFILVLAAGLVWQPGVAGTVLGTEGRKCYPTTFSTASGSVNISVFGDWIENIDRATGPSGVMVTIISKQNGLQNNTPGEFKGKGKVMLRITTTNASPGNNTISLINPAGDTFTFTITVVAFPTVTSVDVPTPADPFKEITVTFRGTGLDDTAKNAEGSIVIHNQIPFLAVGGNASVSGVSVLSSSSTSLQARIKFTALIQDATVDVTFYLDCNPGTAKTRVRVKSSNIKNYVQSITFPNGNTFNENSTGTININLLFAAPSTGSTTVRLRSGTIITLPNPAFVGESDRKVFFKLVPATAFEAVANGTPINATGFTGILANVGEDIIPITFMVKDGNCFGPEKTSVVRIHTWMHSTNTNLPPNFVEETFKVRCIGF
jgi:hypothetical protein